MIFLIHNVSGRIERARCRHCTHHLHGRGYLLACSRKQDEFGVWIVEKYTPLNAYVCDHFQPRSAWSLYDSQIQLSLF